ncbi:MAG: dihydroxy-acid dehydratase [Acidimicrobiales bacterium]|jgi:dihydroxy-acid dehydratase
MKLRSDAWLSGDDEVALDARVALAMGGQGVPSDGGVPVIGIANSASDLNPCNQPLNDLIPSIRAGVTKAGGVAVEFPVMSLGEDLMKPAAMLYRNLVAMEVEESLRSQPLDAVVVLAACDKSVPAALMGALSTNLPTLLLTAGPRPSAHFQGRRIGTGTDLWRLWESRRAGTLSDEEWAQLEVALTLGRGTCNTMGTASTMGALAETIGLAWPGSTSVPAGDVRHLTYAHNVGKRIVMMVRENITPGSTLTRSAFTNAVQVLSAIGGSTNAVIHLTALARRLGVAFTLDDVDVAGRSTPVLVDIEPTGAGLMEDFDAAGGTPSVWRALAARLDGDVVMADGRTCATWSQEAAPSGEVIRSLDDPVDADGAFRVVYGNLAPDGALIKRCAATPKLLAHRGPALVMRSSEDLEETTSSDDEVDPNSVLVLAGAGPVGGPGMPEWGMVSLPKSVLRNGVADMVRVTDARMSGTSFGTVFLHVAPEAAVGGAIGLVESGDMISVDADAGTIDLEVDEPELSRRRKRTVWTVRSARGYEAMYLAHVQQAPDGCDFDFLAGTPGVTPRLEEPVVGRS